MLTFDQSSVELQQKVADGSTIAQTIRAQQLNPETEPFASYLIDSYTQGVAGDTSAQRAWLVAYDSWRKANYAVVTPIAAALGHEIPGQAGSTAEAIATSPFAPQAAPAQAAPALALVEPAAPAVASTNGHAESPVPAPPRRGKRVRATWSHPDVVALTKSLLNAVPQQYVSLVAAFNEQTEGRYGTEGVTAKAIELGLMPAPVGSGSAPKGGLTDEDERSIAEAVLEWIAPETMNPGQRILRLKYAGTYIRELAKSLS
jgi:hypothetical protein